MKPNTGPCDAANTNIGDSDASTDPRFSNANPGGPNTDSYDAATTDPCDSDSSTNPCLSNANPGGPNIDPRDAASTHPCDSDATPSPGRSAGYIDRQVPRGHTKAACVRGRVQWAVARGDRQ